MKLKQPNESPVGGWWFNINQAFDSNIEFNVVSADDGGLPDLVSKTRFVMTQNGLEVPSDLRHWIEDQICQRQPAGKCKYSQGLGDRIGLMISTGAKIIDKLVGTKLQKKASACRGCAKRRMNLN